MSSLPPKASTLQVDPFVQTKAADSGFGLDVLPFEETPELVGSALTKTPPPNYLVLRSNSLKPERLPAQTDEEANATLQRQVRSSQTKVVYLYKLIGAEVFVPSSEFIGPESFKDRLFKGEE